ncbi:MAG: hypothetical protein ACLQNV_19585 [Steroidobacteraceae bacterium]
MSAGVSRPSPIARLLALLSQPQHPYRPATEVFLDLNVDRVADSLQLTKRGRQRGSKNRPPQEAETFDDIEHQILERVEAHKQDAHALYLDHLHTYDQRLAALNFEERFAIIQQAAPEAVGDFRAEAALGRDELFGLRRRLYDSERERDNFRARHKIARPARLSTPGKTVLKIGVLAVLLVIEIVINGSFLSKSNEGGWIGGAIQAVSFATLNIVASFLFGLVPIRLINRRNVLLKFLGLLAFFAYLAFAVVLNLTLSHLREMPPTITGDVGHEVLLQLFQQPLVLHDVNSWVFFGIGLIFSLVAMADGVLFTDPYFGYGALELRCIEARNQYTDSKAELIGRLRTIRDTASEAMNGAARDLSVRRGEYDAILQARARLAQRFIEHQNQIERSARALLAIYREANREARTQPVPSYFSKPYNLERIIYTGNEPNEAFREKLSQSIYDTQSLLAGQIQEVHEVFNEAVRTYREIDDLIPENLSGAASAKVA